MPYKVIATKLFIQQAGKLGRKAKSTLEKKITLLKEDPARNKRLRHEELAFTIRFSDERKEKRAIYTIDGDHVTMRCILDRENGYKDLDEYLKMTGF